MQQTITTVIDETRSGVNIIIIKRRKRKERMSRGDTLLLSHRTAEPDRAEGVVEKRPRHGQSLRRDVTRTAECRKGDQEGDPRAI